MDQFGSIQDQVKEMFARNLAEMERLERVAEATGDERERLIAELESNPIEGRPFYGQWMAIHRVGDDGAWTEEGFAPKADGLPRDIVILWASSYAISDIKNGGFHQFFTNGTGIFAPELHEFLNRLGLDKSATILAEAMEAFGEPYPRSREQRSLRISFLEAGKTGRRSETDPFYSLDQPFYDSLKVADHTFDDHADRWLREECEIQRLSDPPK